jgi:hypothetical protein
MDTDARDVLDNARPDFDQPLSDRRELGFGQRIGVR